MTESPTAEPAPSPRGVLRGWALAGAFALLFALSFPPFGVWPLILLAPVPLAILATHATRRREWIPPVFAWSTILWAWFHWWIIEVSVAGLLPLSLYLACFTTLSVWMLRVLSTGAPRVPLWVALPLVLTGIDFLRATLVLDGYPWYLFHQPWIDATPVASLAWWGGGWLVGVWAGACSGLLAEWCCTPSATPARHRWLGVALPAVALAGLLPWWTSSPDRPDGTLNLLAIQTNLPTDNKIGWTMERKLEDVPAFIDQTVAALERARADGIEVDLVAWPETMLPSVGFEFGDQFSEAIEGVVRRIGVPMLVGSPCYLGIRADAERGWTWDRHFNSAYLVTPGGPPYARVDKVFLTPFGETMPVISNWEWLERQLLAIGASGMSFDLDAGEEIVRLEVPGRGAGGSSRSVRLAVPICFEDTVPGVVRRMVWQDDRRLVDLLVNLSNDGWFANDDAGRSMHELCARWNALANRTPMVRVANTGRSSLIGADGRLDAARGGARTVWSHVFEVPLPGGPAPLYARLGDSVGWSTLLGLVLCLTVKWWYTRRMCRTAGTSSARD